DRHPGAALGRPRLVQQVPAGVEVTVQDLVAGAHLLHQDHIGGLLVDPFGHAAAERGTDAVDVDCGNAEHASIQPHPTDTPEPARHDRPSNQSAGMRRVQGHQALRPRSWITPGTSRLRTTNVSISTPAATMKAIWARNNSGITHSAENVAASTSPAEVITPPVFASPRRTPSRVPTCNDSSRTRVIRKIE